MSNLDLTLSSLSLSLLAYLRGITDCLLSLALPPDNASNRLLFGLAQDLLSEQVLLPTAHYISTPFYFNSSVIGLVNIMYFNSFLICVIAMIAL